MNNSVPQSVMLMLGFVDDPHWGGWIVWYFFLGGIAAGAYFTATLIEIAGQTDDHPLARIGYLLAFPLLVVCGVLLIVDLDHPARFWHMLLKSQVVHAGLDAGWPWTIDGWGHVVRAPLLKYHSPMSIGSWALSLFGCCSGLSCVAAWRPSGWVARQMQRPWCGLLVRVVGCGVGFFVAAYTGALLTATNQPVWSDTPWLAALFLTSAASTGAAAIWLLSHCNPALNSASLDRLHRAETWALWIEAVVLAVFLLSLWPVLPALVGTWHGRLLVSGVWMLGIALPLAVRRWPQFVGRVTGAHSGVASAAAVLVGGLLLRYAMLAVPPEMLRQGPPPSATHQSGPYRGEFGPEAGRVRGGRGADPGNRPLELRTKLFEEERP